jgi:hypothetical protein
MGLKGTGFNAFPCFSMLFHAYPCDSTHQNIYIDLHPLRILKSADSICRRGLADQALHFNATKNMIVPWQVL